VDVYDLSNDFVSELLHLRRLIQRAEKQIFLYRLEVVAALVAFSWLLQQYFGGLA
jgi:hypothetical protein